MLPMMRQPTNDVLGGVGIDLVDMIEPRRRFAAVPWNDPRRSIEIETDSTTFFNPAAGDRQAIGNKHRQTRMPRCLLDATVFIDPFGGRYADRFAVLVAPGLAAFGEQRNSRQSGIDARSRPQLAARNEKVGVRLDQIAAKILDRHRPIVVGLRCRDLNAEAGLVLSHDTYP